MAAIDLSKVKFTKNSDKVITDGGIFNPVGSEVKTLAGNDEIIANTAIETYFFTGLTVELATEILGLVGPVTLSSTSAVRTNAFNNQGSIYTNQGRDVLKGVASAKSTAILDIVAKTIAIANKFDAIAITKIFGTLDSSVIANGIVNSGKINTGNGDDSVDGETTGSIFAAATATVDATAIVDAVAQASYSKGLIAFSQVFAKSLAKATVQATGINNIGGEITTSKGGDTVNAVATSYSATYAASSSTTFSSASPNNQALAIGVAKAIARVKDKAIAIDNTNGSIDLGKGADIINATAKASGTAIAINNIQGSIETGLDDDTIKAYATGRKSYGIFGGSVETGNGNDRVEASSFGGGVNIDTGIDNDFVRGFGEAKINGGLGFDTLDLGSFRLGYFDISFGAKNNQVFFERNDIIMSTSRFEQFVFDNGKSTLTYDQLVAAV
ncbi:hypothetical protein H6G76_14850 [Nostoc sp. FACHB-152]|uniref:hypothetical protein n=1 Tax=unclassified Nostoc TaxID=2593658 RepID=UPI00168479E3|nr:MULTISPECIES: hypothetical protein [unclassified Nostoc]MBD2448414.1 hypothetical protein [Nostoc sp. FACHB-152]MBD2470854.1 hypothetical protein [Nostoc sp. FACHB-145]